MTRLICTQARGAHITDEVRAEVTSCSTCKLQLSGESMLFHCVFFRKVKFRSYWRRNVEKKKQLIGVSNYFIL